MKNLQLKYVLGEIITSTEKLINETEASYFSAYYYENQNTFKHNSTYYKGVLHGMKQVYDLISKCYFEEN